MKEIWRSVPAIMGLYEVSSAGNVRRVDNHRAKTATLHVDGYLVVRLWNEGMSTSAYVHRIVAQAFLGDCPDGYEVGWKNTDRTDNRANNLEYIHASERSKRSHESGLGIHGEDSWNAKLTEAKVRQIRRLLAIGVGIREIARKYNVAPSGISRIKNGKSWTHIT